MLKAKSTFLHQSYMLMQVQKTPTHVNKLLSYIASFCFQKMCWNVLFSEVMLYVMISNQLRIHTGEDRVIHLAWVVLTYPFKSLKSKDEYIW